MAFLFTWYELLPGIPSTQVSKLLGSFTRNYNNIACILSMCTLYNQHYLTSRAVPYLQATCQNEEHERKNMYECLRYLPMVYVGNHGAPSALSCRSTLKTNRVISSPHSMRCCWPDREPCPTSVSFPQYHFAVEQTVRSWEAFRAVLLLALLYQEVMAQALVV